MKTKKFTGLFIFIFISFLLSKNSFSEEATPAVPNKPIAWNEKMQGLYKTLSELLTQVSSDQRYQDEKNHIQIENEIKTLASFAHDLNQKNKKNTKIDPAMRIFADHLNTDANEALQAFHEGRKDFARTLIRSLTNSCIACHSRNPSGPHFGELPLSISPSELKPIERARFYSASRQYDRSISEYLKIIDDKQNAQNSTWDWEEAIKQSLAISVRVNKDPKIAQKILKSILENESAPYYLKNDAKTWKLSVDQWQKNPAEPKSSKEALKEAKNLMALAKKTQAYPLDHSADILYLRASSLLFTFIDSTPESKDMSEVLYLVGLCNESISPREFENLPRLFYDECIQRSPHTEIAQKCFKKYEEQVYFAFTGSAGTHLPQEVKQKVEALKNSAFKKVEDQDKK